MTSSRPASLSVPEAATAGRTTCRHQSKPHTIWWWLHDPHDPVPAPYSQTLDNRADALEWVTDWVKEPPVTLRWVKVFRADNEAYTCWRWDNPEPLPEPEPVDIAAPRKRRWWRR